MHPIVAQFYFLNKEIIIGSYGLLIIISLFLSASLTFVLAQKKNYFIADIIEYILLIFSGGFLFALIVGLLYTRGIEKINNMYSIPLISWGGFTGVIIVIVIFKLAWKTEVLKLLDLISPGYALALSIGRIGCFMGGCCYGKHTNLSCGIYYTHYLAPASHKLQPLVPIQLISSLLLFILAIVLVYLFLKSNSPGNTFITFIIIYSISRFIIEYFRDDSRYYALNLSDGQIFSILMFIAGIILIFRKNLINFIRSKTINQNKNFN